MSDALTFPEAHWADTEIRNWRDYVPGWEKQLRARVEANPDPETRFDVWLAALQENPWGAGGVRLWFFEQPWLARAQAVEKILERGEREGLERAISAVREVLDPRD